MDPSNKDNELANKKATKQKRHWSRVAFIVLIMTIAALLTIGGLWLYDYLKTTASGDDMPSSETVLTSTVVSEKEPTITEEYTVPAGQPRLISIESLNVEAYVQRVGVTPDNEMAAPNNLFFAGWYVNGAVPGEKGVSIINGHAGGRYRDGVFHRLNELRGGETIRVQMGDKTWRVFEVERVDSYSLDEASTALYEADSSIREALHLITCDGVFDDKTQTYDRRVIVVAKRIE